MGLPQQITNPSTPIDVLSIDQLHHGLGVMVLYVKTLAEYFGFRPTKFLPNGCGAGITRKLIPDELAGANFDDCCDLHDLAYHVGKDGFVGLFTQKPFEDFALAQCMARRFERRSFKLFVEGRKVRSAIVAALSAWTPILYFLGLTLLGWTPLTWPWKERPMPSHEDLQKLLEHNRKD